MNKILNIIHGWKPIKEAKKDGTVYHLSESGAGHAIGKWMRNCNAWTDYNGSYLHPDYFKEIKGPFN